MIGAKPPEVRVAVSGAVFLTAGVYFPQDI
jgi:hypothetical protein